MDVKFRYEISRGSGFLKWLLLRFLHSCNWIYDRQENVWEDWGRSRASNTLPWSWDETRKHTIFLLPLSARSFFFRDHLRKRGFDNEISVTTTLYLHLILFSSARDFRTPLTREWANYCSQATFGTWEQQLCVNVFFFSSFLFLALSNFYVYDAMNERRDSLDVAIVIRWMTRPVTSPQWRYGTLTMINVSGAHDARELGSIHTSRAAMTFFAISFFFCTCN